MKDSVPPIHHRNDRTLINVAAENNRHLNTTPLKTPWFRSLAPRVYYKEKRNPAKKEEVISREIDLTPKTPVNLVIAKN